MCSGVIITERTLAVFCFVEDGRRRDEEGLAQGKMAKGTPLETPGEERERERMSSRIWAAGNSHLISAG